MTDEVKETIEKMADYADTEKALLLNRVRIISIVGLISLLTDLIMEIISSRSMIPVYEYVKGTCLGLAVAALITMVLYTTAILAKIREKRAKYMKKNCYNLSCRVICLIASIIAII